VEQYVLSHAQTRCLKGSDWIEVAVTKYLSDEDLQPVSGSKAEPATSGKMALAARTEGKWLHSHGSRVAWTLERADSSQVRSSCTIFPFREENTRVQCLPVCVTLIINQSLSSLTRGSNTMTSGT
jgi:hypothetical protein